MVTVMHAYSKDPLRLSAVAAPGTWSALKAAGAGALDWLAASWPVERALAFCAALAADRRARATVRELESWDDHRLRDIGLERMDVEAAVRGVRPLFRWQPDCDRAALQRLDRLG
jgi:uncharacterized protein YjiS (DUF1127 family)